VSLRLACLLALLLIVGGVEPNPSPTKLENLAHRIEDLLLEIHSMRAELSPKNDALTTEVNNCKALAMSHGVRLDMLEQAQATLLLKLLLPRPLPLALLQPRLRWPFPRPVPCSMTLSESSTYVRGRKPTSSSLALRYPRMPPK
jgi:hypothetical protein